MEAWKEASHIERSHGQHLLIFVKGSLWLCMYVCMYIYGCIWMYGMYVYSEPQLLQKETRPLNLRSRIFFE